MNYLIEKICYLFIKLAKEKIHCKIKVNFSDTDILKLSREIADVDDLTEYISPDIIKEINAVADLCDEAKLVYSISCSGKFRCVILCS